MQLHREMLLCRDGDLIISSKLSVVRMLSVCEKHINEVPVEASR